MERRRHPDDQKALRLLRSYAGISKNGPVTLSAEYLHAVARCEALAENQNGCDKTWVERSRRQFHEYYARAKQCAEAWNPSPGSRAHSRKRRSGSS